MNYKKWNELSLDEQDLICINQEIPEKIIANYSHMFRNYQIDLILIHQKVPDIFLIKHFYRLKEYQVDSILRHQQLPKKVIEKLFHEEKTDCSNTKSNIFSSLLLYLKQNSFI